MSVCVCVSVYGSRFVVRTASRAIGLRGTVRVCLCVMSEEGRPVTTDHRLTTSGQRLTTSDQRVTNDHRRPAISDRPATSGQRAATSGPAADGRTAVVGEPSSHVASGTVRRPSPPSARAIRPSCQAGQGRGSGADAWTDGGEGVTERRGGLSHPPPADHAARPVRMATAPRDADPDILGKTSQLVDGRTVGRDFTAGNVFLRCYRN